MFCSRRFVLGNAVFLAAVALVGCSDNYGGRMEVAGDVKLQDQPLKGGVIRFVPLEGQDTPGGASIVNGQYQIPRKNGLKPGKYLVQLSSGDGKTPNNEEEAGGPGGSTNIVSVDQIPEDWNVRSKQQIEVKPEGGNRFDFAIPNINPRLKRR